VVESGVEQKVNQGQGMTFLDDQVYSGKHALITGGMGFIGSNLARRLLQLGAVVTIVDNLDPYYGGNPYNLHGIEKDVKVIIADINDEAQIGGILKDQDFLFNLAGQISHVGSMQDPHKDLQSNGFGQLSLLEMCRKHNENIRVVYSSTRQVYGRAQYLPVDEKHPLGPVDMNGVSKLTGEDYHLVSHRAYKMNTAILRLTNTYGPRIRVRDAHKGFIGYWFRQILEGKEIPIFDKGQQLRDFNYVEDVVEALLLTAANPHAIGQIYNLGAQPVSLLQLAELMIAINGSGSYHFEPFPPERGQIDIGDYYGDFSKIQTQLGWSPVTSLKDGLTKTMEYYYANQDFYF